MKNVISIDRISIRRAAVSAAVLSTLGSVSVWAHGPNVVLSDVNGQIVTNQLDVTPQNDSTIASDYPVLGPARVFPSQYNVNNFNTFATSNYSSNAPTSLAAIPVNFTTVAPLVNMSSGTTTYDTTGNAGLYGQIELTDAIGNSTVDTGPGYAYGNGGFSATAAVGNASSPGYVPATSTVFQITFAHTLQYFNTSSGQFTATPDGEQLQAIRGSSFPSAGTAFANTLTSNNYQTGTGLQVSVTSSQNGGSHSQLLYRFLEANGQAVDNPGQYETAPTSSEIADGIYLATFDIGTASTSSYQLQSSLPYYFLYEVNRNNDVTTAQLNEAVAATDSIAGVPEPTSLGLLAIAGGALLGRRRRYVP